MSFIGNMQGYLGYSQHIRGRLERAMPLYEKAYKKGMGYRFQLAYGLGLLRTSRFEEARDVFTRILVGGAPDTIKSNAKFNQGLVYWKLGLLDQALATMEEAWRKEPNSKSYGALGYFKVLKGDLNDALDFNLKALEYDDEDPVVLDNLGMIYYQLQDTDKALMHFLRAEEERAKQASTLYYLGRIYREKGEIELAREKLSKALTCDINPLSAVTREEIEAELALLG